MKKRKNRVSAHNEPLCGFTQGGDFETWRQTVARCRKNAAVKMLVASSFAGPVLKKLGAAPFACCIWGASGIGKTLALMVAMSVWGNPEPGKLVKSYAQALEGVTAASRQPCLPVAIDEFCAGKAEWQALAHGLERGELCRHSVFLFAGEELFAGQKTAKHGKNRMFEMFCENLFDDAETIRGVILKNYGHAGKEFVRILAGAVGLRTSFDSLYGMIRWRYGAGEAQAEALAAVMLADQLVTEHIIRDGNPLTIRDMGAWLYAADRSPGRRLADRGLPGGGPAMRSVRREVGYDRK